MGLFLQEIVKKKSSLLIEGLWDAPKALILKELLEAHNKPILVITGGTRQSDLYEDLKTFVDGKALAFPARELEPSPDVIGRRFAILNQMGSAQIILSPLQGCLEKVPSSGLTFEWTAGDEVIFEDIPKKLTELGYRREKVVSDKGEFAVRGGIIDLYPLSSFDPYRIEFFGDVIDDIRTFDIGSQKSIEKVNSLVICPAKEEATASLFDYFDDDLTIVFDDLIAIEDQYIAIKNLPGLSTFDDLMERIKDHRKLFFTKEEMPPGPLEIYYHKVDVDRMRHPFVRPDAVCLEGFETTLFATSEAEEKALLKTLPVTPKVHRGYLSSGYALVDEKKIVLASAEITGKKRIPREKWREHHHAPASEFHELEIGDLVVHLHNGIGRYLGVENDFFIIEYAGKSKFFVPLAQAHLISRYIGAHEERPQLSQLGAANWKRTKVRAEKAIIGYARDLLNRQAERVASGGFVCPPDSDEMRLFEDEFPFVESEDQVSAIAEVKADMTSDKAMDRLICGDVGYGKTEVAMRAAMKAAHDGGKQVAVLVPTTVLAMQHYDNFKLRFKNFPLEVGVVSRFVKPKKALETLKRVKEGKVDILIGTHRLVSKDVAFKDLGLIIIDEEQRFGVRAKEHLKKLQVGVDCLTLSATPIPRTLYMSLIGTRDMSTISTPPQDRLPIRTILAERDAKLIQNAFMRELARGGQGYFIHNRVETIHKVADELEKLLPTARILVVHGQMSADAIDKIFHAFKSGEADILVATTIVENGIDIPTANTIVIDRADRFGMADLYQLRGRVGRWNLPSYALFLVPEKRTLTEESRRRLGALVETSGFGGGMKLAMRDLEIRGAGDLLGVKQAGQVSSIGFHLYCKLLKRTINALKKNKSTSFIETKIESPWGAKVPEFYIPETSLRLEIYHRLGEAGTKTEVEAIGEELVDRFGPMPEEVLWLLQLGIIRTYAESRGFLLLKFGKRMLLAQRQMPKRVVSKQLLLPRVEKPEKLTEIVLPLLENNFG